MELREKGHVASKEDLSNAPAPVLRPRRDVVSPLLSPSPLPLTSPLSCLVRVWVSVLLSSRGSEDGVGLVQSQWALLGTPHLTPLIRALEDALQVQSHTARDERDHSNGT